MATIDPKWWDLRWEVKSALKNGPLGITLDAYLYHGARDGVDAIEIECLHAWPVSFPVWDGGSIEILAGARPQWRDKSGERCEPPFEGEWNVGAKDTFPFGPIDAAVFYVWNSQRYFSFPFPSRIFEQMVILVKHRAGLKVMRTGIEQAGLLDSDSTGFDFAAEHIQSQWRVHITPTKFGDERIVMERSFE